MNVDTADVLSTLVSALAYGGIGAYAGFLVGVSVADRHRVNLAIMEGNPDLPEPRHFLRGDRLQRLVVILVSVALLLAGLGWLQSQHQAKLREERNCELLAEMVTVLKDRALAGQDQAVYNRQVWTDLRRIIVRSPATKPSSPVVVSIDRYLRSQARYQRRVEGKPLPTVPKGCGR